ncbi:MAG: type II/IV secretion system protein [Planctomycetes bacterium]|nr:type II/IV secretion system protein [Planctomycetota bacterium]MCH8258963.1 type II/IV secretion system protein [Planctomycetota bacterium]
MSDELSKVGHKKAKSSAPAPCDALSSLYTPEEAGGVGDGGDIGQQLLKRGVVESEQLDAAQRVLKQTPGRHLSEILIEMGVDEAAVQEVVASESRLPFARAEIDDSDSFDAKLLNRLGPEYCKENLVLPLRKEGSRLLIGTASPDDVFLLDDVKRRLGVTSVKHVLVTAGDIRGIVEAMTEDDADEYNIDEILSDVDEDDVEVVQEKEDNADAEEAASSPVIRFVNHIIQTAMKEGASDIHIEPEEKALRVRFRIDGVLFDVMNPPKRMHAAITSRIKIMANLDIAERRLPQDGRIRATVIGRKIDLRVSTVPTPKGEKTVLRILDTRSINVGLDELGFAPDTLTIWKNQVALPHGIVLVTGPTGSGKTTTLYSSIQQMNIRKLNISTVEDPVEYNLDGITQIQAHEKIGMTFATALRALLRQDPDVIMIGEIRDLETATIAIQAALTGHLVLSTLHTNDAPSSITRLINIGTEPFLIGAAVNSVLAQRLVRRICKHCKAELTVTPEIEEFLTMHGIPASQVMKGKGCPRCRETGYSGRVGLYELLLLDDHLRDAIARNPNVTEFRRMCIERGMVTLREDGFQKVAAGSTTVEEVLRVTEATI